MRASDRAYAVLRDEIVSWKLAPGTVLAEVEQANRLGISRTPLREALTHLISDNLVTPLGGRGLVVSEVSVESIRELYEARQGLEQQAARLAALRHDPAVFERLREQFAAVPELLATDNEARKDYYDLVHRLDNAMDEATHNDYLVQAISGIRTHMIRIRHFAADNPNRLLEAAREHLQIVEGVMTGDPDLAASLTHVHLHASMMNTLAGIEGTQHHVLPQSQPADLAGYSNSIRTAR